MPGQLPVVDDQADGAEPGARAGQIRQIPDEVRLHDVRLRIDVPEQLVRLRLVRSVRERSVGVVLEPRRDVLPVVEPHDVVEAERNAVAESPLHRQLQRVVRAPRQRGRLGDRAVAAERRASGRSRPRSRPASRLPPGSDPGSAAGYAAPKSTALRFDARCSDVVAVLADVANVERRWPTAAPSGRRAFHCAEDGSAAVVLEDRSAPAAPRREPGLPSVCSWP